MLSELCSTNLWAQVSRTNPNQSSLCYLQIWNFGSSTIGYSILVNFGVYLFILLVLLQGRYFELIFFSTGFWCNPARNLTEEERKGYKEITWDSKEVCGAYMVRFCPHDLFVNTRSDLGASQLNFVLNFKCSSLFQPSAWIMLRNFKF